jgi:hypothetical protein
MVGAPYAGLWRDATDTRVCLRFTPSSEVHARLKRNEAPYAEKTDKRQNEEFQVLPDRAHGFGRIVVYPSREQLPGNRKYNRSDK